MSLRFSALNNLLNPGKVDTTPATKVTAIFAENVFTHQVARQFLSDEAYKSLMGSIKAGQKIDRSMAAQIANGIRAWTTKARLCPVSAGLKALVPSCRMAAKWASTALS